ncbi:MAG TPA: hypothetical protein VJ385_19990 [Fibrobacteria bacterium]|nr:hypothetical protein [Fibrobacteria bacterium]
MANTSDEPVADGKRFKADPLRIAVFAVLACGVYGAGILAVMFAAFSTVKAVHASQGIPVLPWAAAFVLVVSGMLSVIYGFFFRPRECRLSGEQVAIVYWDGNGKVMSRNQLESITVGRSRIVLVGGGKRLVVGRIYSGWKQLSGELGAWKAHAA